MDTAERLREKSLVEHIRTLTVARVASDRLLDQVLDNCLAGLNDELSALRQPRQFALRRLHLGHLRYRLIADYNDGEGYQLFGFRISDLQRIFAALDFPARLRISRTWVVSGQMAFLFLLWRFHTGTLLIQSEHTWGYGFTSLSRISLASCKFLQDNHLHRLRDLAPFVDSFEIYNRAIHDKLAELGLPVPPELADVALFHDVCSVQGAKPWVRIYISNAALESVLLIVLCLCFRELMRRSVHFLTSTITIMGLRSKR